MRWYRSSLMRLVREHPAPSGALRLRRTPRTKSLRRVREHPAPSGALRSRRGFVLPSQYVHVREHPAPPGALRRLLSLPGCLLSLGQGAPSTTRCIETPPGSSPTPRTAPEVREHPAPSGALRPGPQELVCVSACVREHPAPSGAFTTLLHRGGSWSSAHVPRGGGRPVLRWRLARARRQRPSGSFLL